MTIVIILLAIIVLVIVPNEILYGLLKFALVIGFIATILGVLSLIVVAI